ncbi:DUF559 domain-containing protein [Nocardioides sp. KIGAM211]|uniref:DUF559 domain-containing protein n=1 Tax=Nocardioides luti TaxID=2761101 RepID=A0A7X0VAI3_9ACTN|nr:DUF559 domain-containing protein [Nocardioides luti]MBB6626982.1 DUF559 domain-containing protein [Nocardioides luti]
MTDRPTPQLRELRRRRAERLAADQAGVISLVQAYALGLTRGEVRAAVASRRWRRHGTQSVVTHNGPLTQEARFWAAVQEAGPRAHLDGESALIAAGLANYESRTIRVSVPRGARVRRGAGLNIRQTRRWSSDDLAASGVPRTRPAVAAIRAALWARSDKQAALLLAMTVQQGLATAEQLGAEMLRVRRDRRRLLIHDVLLDLLGGARSLGEIDFARECRRRGLPEPSRQVVRRGRNGRYYLDVSWEEWRVVVEIDGIQHQWAVSVVDEALRQNAVTLQDARVLRLPLLGLRVAPDDFFEQIEQALRDGGCPLERSA